jgi:hypothetical protein
MAGIRYHFELKLVNPYFIRQLPGRKSESTLAAAWGGHFDDLDSVVSLYLIRSLPNTIIFCSRSDIYPLVINAGKLSEAHFI